MPSGNTFSSGGHTGDGRKCAETSGHNTLPARECLAEHFTRTPRTARGQMDGSCTLPTQRIALRRARRASPSSRISSDCRQCLATILGNAPGTPFGQESGLPPRIISD
jgi:hypothetical protein